MIPRSSNFTSSKCACCGVEAECLVCCSAFGSFSFAACAHCIEVGKEPYRNIVDYISAAGHWPQDINSIYQEEVRRQLKLHGIPEEVFKFEVERAIVEEQAFIQEYCNQKIDIKDLMESRGDF